MLEANKKFKAYVYNKVNEHNYANDKVNERPKLKSVLGRKESIEVKEENAGHQHFLLFPTMFSNGAFPRVVKSQICAS